MVKAPLMHLLAWACISSLAVARPDTNLPFGRPLTNRRGLGPPISQPPSFPPYTYLGCYLAFSGDFNQQDPLLTGPSFASATLTYQNCAIFCTTYTYFGVRNGNSCQCGNELSTETLSQPQSGCNQECSGNTNQICGADNLFTIFKAPLPVVSSSIFFPPLILGIGFNILISSSGSQQSSPSNEECPSYITSPC
jgi:hypothetical protein